MAAADGVVSARERKVLSEFAAHYGLVATKLIRRAYAMAKENATPEVEVVDPRALAGRKFEDFVVSLCSDKKRFKLLAWRGDKISGSTYAIENLLPDLRIRHSLDTKVVEYFVECKYRSSVKNSVLDLTDRLSRYRAASAEHKCELFFAIGVGGSPTNPEQFFMIPSRLIKGGHVLNLEDYASCLCPLSGDDFHNYINHFFHTRVFKTVCS